MAKNRRNQNAVRPAPGRKSAQQGSEAVNTRKATVSKSTPHNPFEIKWSRQKHNVARRDKPQAQQQSKTTVGKPVRSRAQAIEYRRNTLLSEWKKRNRKSDFKDKRIGERDATMTLEDKMLERFAHQHKKKARNNPTRFNLADDVDDDRAAEDMVPVWSSQRMPGGINADERKEAVDIDTVWDAQKNAGGSMRNAANPFDADDDDLENKLGEQYVSKQHFGGGLLQRRDEDSITHDQRINELISESKREKYEKQKAKDEVIGMTEEVDNEWRALLRDGFNVLSMYERRQKREAPSVQEADGGKNDTTSTADEQDAAADDNDDKDYDEAYKLLSQQPGLAVREANINASVGEAKRSPVERQPDDSQPAAAVDHRDDSANAKLEHKKLTNRVSAASAQTKSMSSAHISMLKTFPDTFRAFRAAFEAVPVESRVAALTDLLTMYHPSLDELNNKRIERLFNYVMLYVLTSNEYRTFTLLRELKPLIVRLWNFTVTNSLPQITKFLAKIDDDTDGCAPHGGHLAFLHLLSILMADNAVEFSRHESDRERRSEQHTSHDMLWKSTMLIVEKLMRKSARGRCAAFKCLFSISIATDMLESRQQSNTSKVAYSTALTTALQRLAEQSSSYLRTSSLVQDQDADSMPANDNPAQELFARNSTWSRSAAIKCSCMVAQLIRRLMHMWRSLESFEIIFSPTIDAVKTARAAVDSSNHVDTTEEHKLFQQQSDELLRDYAALKPPTLIRLHFLRQKPKPLPMLEPKLDMDEKSRSEKKQREKRRSLQNAVRKEMKGAKREIRRDNQFLARQQLVEQTKLDEQRKRKLKELMHGLQTQEHEHKVMEKQKRRFKNDKKRIRL